MTNFLRPYSTFASSSTRPITRTTYHSLTTHEITLRVRTDPIPPTAPQIRFINLAELTISSFPLAEAPLYIAASHVWAERRFAGHDDVKKENVATEPTGDMPGVIGLREAAARLSVEWAWVDNFCIDQASNMDKARQISMMGNIYSRAVATVVLIPGEFSFSSERFAAMQADIPSVKTYQTGSAYAQIIGRDPQRYISAIYGMLEFLEGLLASRWHTRVWTLQELVLAQRLLVVSHSGETAEIRKGACDATYNCLIRYHVAHIVNPGHQYFRGMEWLQCLQLWAVARKNPCTYSLHQSAVRDSANEVDKIYGVMVLTGVVIPYVAGEDLREAWRRWFARAIDEGHMMWLLYVPSFVNRDVKDRNSCLVPPLRDLALARPIPTSALGQTLKANRYPVWNEDHSLQVNVRLITIQGDYERVTGLFEDYPDITRDEKDGRKLWFEDMVWRGRGDPGICRRLVTTAVARPLSRTNCTGLANILTSCYPELKQRVSSGARRQQDIMLDRDTWNPYIQEIDERVIRFGLDYYMHWKWLLVDVSDGPFAGYEFLVTCTDYDMEEIGQLTLVDLYGRSPGASGLLANCLVVQRMMDREERPLHKFGLARHLPRKVVERVFGDVQGKTCAIGGERCRCQR